MEIEAKTTMDGWREALKAIMQEGKDCTDISKRTYRELLNFTMTIENYNFDAEKPIQLMNNFEKWVYPSQEELTGIIMSKKKPAEYDYIIGLRIFNFQEQINQVNDFVIPLLKNNPNTRRAIVNVYNPVKDSRIGNKHVPSIMNIFFKREDGKLHLTFFIRSNDFFIGWPATVFQMKVLHEYVAKKLGLEMGSLTTISASAHMFHDNFDDINRVIGE